MHYHHFCRFLAWNSNFIMKFLWSRKRKRVQSYKNKKVWSKNSPKIWSYFKVCIYHCVSIYSHHLYSILYLTFFKSIPLWPSHYVLLLFQNSCCPSWCHFRDSKTKSPIVLLSPPTCFQLTLLLGEDVGYYISIYLLNGEMIWLEDFNSYRQ